MIQRLIAWLVSLLGKAPTEPQTVPRPEPVLPTPTPESLDWTTQKGAYHAVRVTCDDKGLTLDEKNLICACIFQESRFYNKAKCENKKDGKVWSTDWGICQINDYWQVGVGKPFSSAQEIVDNPQKAVEFMISMYKSRNLKAWVSYSSGAYETWLMPASPMWKLVS